MKNNLFFCKLNDDNFGMKAGIIWSEQLKQIESFENSDISIIRLNYMDAFVYSVHVWPGDEFICEE